MKHPFKPQPLFLLIALFQLSLVLRAQYHYPPTKTVEVVDTLWGVTVPDPYRWLEDLKDPEVVDWFKTQADYTYSVLAKVPGQDEMVRELQTLDGLRTARYRPVAKGGGKYFYQKRLPGEEVSKLYYRQGKSGEEVLLFDPQQFVEGKTFDFIPAVSDDGSNVLLNLSEAGAEIGDIRFIDVATGTFLPDVIPHSGWGAFAGGSNAEVLYSELKGYDVHDPENLLGRPNKLHVLGTPVPSDIVVASATKNPELGIQPAELPMVSVFKDSPYMVLGRYTVENNLTLYYAPKAELKNDAIHWKPLTVPEDEARKFYVHGNDIYFLTSRGNPRLKMVKTSFENPDLKTSETVFEGSSDWQISDDPGENLIAQTKDYLLFTKSKHELVAKTYAYEFETENVSEVNVPLEGNVYVQGLSKADNEVVLMNMGWAIPLTYYSYDAQARAFSEGAFHAAHRFPNLENIVYEEVEVPSHDGTPVPLSIVYNKTKVKRDGSSTVLMHGYGAYGMTPYVPQFRMDFVPLLNRGVILAAAHVRGGGEKGNDWYLAGKKTTKPNTWKDFNACAEWLIRNNYTSPAKFGITGASAGGILIGRAITERPDLYQVAIPAVGCLNALRMEFSPNGPGNIPEFGTVTDSVEFRALLEMDACQHIQSGVEYPAQLITAGWNDPRVVAYQPAKFAARMQAENGSEKPVLLYVDHAAGHFGGSTIQEYWQQIAKEYAFLLWQTGHPEFQPGK